jgi:hypothetical protein
MAMSSTPPTISAARNCQPRKIRIRMPSSITRLVEANMNATAATKCAPLSTRLRAAARAAKEHELDMAPNTVASPMLRGVAFPSRGARRAFGTNAWIMALTA